MKVVGGDFDLRNRASECPPTCHNYFGGALENASDN